MKVLIRLLVLAAMGATCAWAAGVRFNPAGLASQLRATPSNIRTLVMADGKEHTGLIVKESEDIVKLEIEQGVAIEFSRDGITEIKDAGGGEAESRASLAAALKKPLFTYDEDKNHFKGLQDSVNGLFMGEQRSPEELREYGKKLKRNWAWQTGGREAFTRSMDQAARRSLGKMAHMMDDMTPAERRYRQQQARR